MKILAFGASNSRNSINKTFAAYAAGQVVNAETILIDLNDFEMPIYSIDIEKDTGIPDAAFRFRDHVRAANAIIISFAEHNGNYTVAFKNIFDWVSRIDRNIWMNKPMLLLSAAPGPRGGQRVLESALIDMERKGGRIISSFSLPSYWNNFSEEKGITNAELSRDFERQLKKFIKALKNDVATVEA